MSKYDNTERYQPVVKKIFDRKLYLPEIGTEVYNHLEDSRYIVDENKPYVLIGNKGEEWCVDKKTLLKSYQLTESDLEKLEVGMEPITIQTKPGVLQWATHIDDMEQIQVQTSWGEVLTSNLGDGHGKGDWIVCSDKNGQPDLNDRWVLNGEIFEQTIHQLEKSPEIDLKEPLTVHDSVIYSFAKSMAENYQEECQLIAEFSSGNLSEKTKAKMADLNHLIGQLPSAIEELQAIAIEAYENCMINSDGSIFHAPIVYSHEIEGLIKMADMEIDYETKLAIEAAVAEHMYPMEQKIENEEIENDGPIIGE